MWGDPPSPPVILQKITAILLFSTVILLGGLLRELSHLVLQTSPIWCSKAWQLLTSGLNFAWNISLPTQLLLQHIQGVHYKPLLQTMVANGSFSKLINMAASIPRMYGYAPTITELYKTEDETNQARRKMFTSMDLKGTGVITIDEWPKLCQRSYSCSTSYSWPWERGGI